MTDFTDLTAIYLNCTLERSPEPSHTQLLIDRSVAVMAASYAAARASRLRLRPSTA